VGGREVAVASKRKKTGWDMRWKQEGPCLTAELEEEDDDDDDEEEEELP
jgi:hypothetical protein